MSTEPLPVVRFAWLPRRMTDRQWVWLSWYEETPTTRVLCLTAQGLIEYLKETDFDHLQF